MFIQQGFTVIYDSNLIFSPTSHPTPPTHTHKHSQTLPPPPGWTGANVNTAQTAFLVGQTIPVSCPKGQRFKGYQRKGNGTLTCRSDQTWTPITAVCESEYKHSLFPSLLYLLVALNDKKWLY